MPRIETTDELIPSWGSADINKNAKIQYFAEILTSTYKIPYGATIWNAQSLINKILKNHGFSDFYHNEKSKYLSDLAFNNFPEWWLEKIYEDVRKAPAKHAPAVDRAFKDRDWRYYEYALAIALLIEPEEWARLQDENVLISIHGIQQLNQRVWAAIT